MTGISAEKAKQLGEAFAGGLIGKTPQGMDYVPIAEVVARLNRVMGVGNWHKEILRFETWGAQETSFGPCPVHVIASVRVSLRGEDGEWVSTDGVGGQDVGFYKDKSRGPLNLGDAYKGAVSDATKKALQELGVALELARNDEAIRIEAQQQRELEQKQVEAQMTDRQKAVVEERGKLKSDAQKDALVKWWKDNEFPRTHQLTDDQADAVLDYIGEFLMEKVS